MPSNVRVALGLLAIVSLFTAIIMLVQIAFKAIGWVGVRSSWYAPFMEEILLGSLILFVLLVLILWKATTLTESSKGTERQSAGSVGSVWVSAVRNDPNLSRRLTFDLLEQDEARALDLLNRNQSGIPLDPEDIPKRFTDLTTIDDDHPRDVHPGELIVSGFVVMSKRMADVLTGFDLGEGRVTNIDGIYQRDGTRHSGEFSVLTFGARKEAFEPDHSNQRFLTQFAAGVPKWIVMVHDADDDDFAVNVTALDGADLWIDAKAPQVCFLSNRLYQALREAGMAHYWDAKRCRVVDA